MCVVCFNNSVVSVGGIILYIQCMVVLLMWVAGSLSCCTLDQCDMAGQPCTIDSPHSSHILTCAGNGQLLSVSLHSM